MTRILVLLDHIRFAFATRQRTQNGSTKLLAWHQAITDADDSLEIVGRAIADGDLAEAQRLVDLGRESLAGYIEELKELL